MLVLTRRREETIILRVDGIPDIVVTVVEVKDGGAVRIGVDADHAVSIVRGEIDGEKIKPGSRGERMLLERAV